MKLTKIMGETIEGIIVRKNTVLVLRPRNRLTAEQHQMQAKAIVAWGKQHAIRATMIPHELDLLALDDETGGAVLRQEQFDFLSDRITKLAATVVELREELAVVALRRTTDAPSD